jgi:hypothetical protein
MKDVGCCHKELIPFLVVSAVLVLEKNKMNKSLESGCYWLELLVFVMAGSVETERDEEMGLFL